ncbi:hypothetical protein [Algoriphagus pacificus]|uniref:Uncharacterized protein n=1 Tax=Algoriphagus pacificus TaxID=2811234 RepID=A0ABS3CBR2_9BACT|nr:hypothetical protein [Algoriphagus pacificus]MBN7814552.1 hypothetical protein [Algoriphagus pacificus]
MKNVKNSLITKVLQFKDQFWMILNQLKFKTQKKKAPMKEPFVYLGAELFSF